jgi:hypothetical protein
MGAVKGEKIDHRNHDTLDNRRQNLRRATPGQNQKNRRGAAASSKTGVRGVCRDKRRRLWKAEIQVDYKRVFLGRFPEIKDAAKAYQNANRKYFGVFGGGL